MTKRKPGAVRGAPKKPGARTVHVSTRIRPDAAEALDRRATTEGRTRSKVAGELLEAALLNNDAGGNDV